MMLYAHQKILKEKNPNKAILCWEGGTGKTVGAAIWLKQGRDKDALVICSKRIIKKWEAELLKWETKALVVSKEQFKKLPKKKYTGLIVDEADEFASPLFTKQRSQLSTSLYTLIQAYPEMPTLLLTATPIRSSPWNLHTLLCFMGIYIDHKRWRNAFFSLERRPYLRFPAWLAKPNWRTEIRKPLEKYADIVLLKDCVDDLPPFVEEVISIKSPPFTSMELEPMAAFVDEHKHEQKDKVKYIVEAGKEYRKVLVVAHYVEQVEQLQKDLSKHRETFAIWGKIKDQESVIKQATESTECFFIVQASLGVGFDADSFSCVVFASMSFKVRDWVQLKYRVRRIHNLHPVIYYYLIAGACDKNVYKTIKAGRDFVPSEYKNVTTITKN
jgi:hypothetical protein